MIGQPDVSGGVWRPIAGLNVSYVIAFNTGEQSVGMNTTMGEMENQIGFGSAPVSCQVLELAVHAALPEYPAFDCTGGRH